MPESPPGKLLAALRFAVGGSSWLTPRVFEPYGIHVGREPQLRYVARLFGVRDAMLGVGVATTDGDARRLWWQIAVACDAADAVAALISLRRGDVSTASGLALTAFALTAASLGAAALAADDV